MTRDARTPAVPLAGDEGRKMLEIDGKPFFPIGLYSVPRTEDFEEIAGRGFNCVHSYEHERALFVNYQAPRRSTLELRGEDDEQIRGYLRTASRHGLKVMLGFDRLTQLKRQPQPLTEEEKQGITQRVRAFAGEQALLGWYLLDEPDGSCFPPAKCLEVQALVKGLDPAHPTITVLCVPQKAEEYSAVADVIMHDNYPIPQSTITELGEAFGRYAACTAGRGPLWSVPQVFDWRSYDRTRRDGRFPTPAEVRCMTYLSIVQGATGVLFFCYDNEVHSISGNRNPEGWEATARLAGELCSLSPVLVSSAPVSGLAHGGGICAWARAVGSEHWVIAVNPAPTPVTWRLFLRSGRYAPVAKVEFEGRDVAVRDGVLTDCFDPFAVHVYRCAHES